MSPIHSWNKVSRASRVSRRSGGVDPLEAGSIADPDFWYGGHETTADDGGEAAAPDKRIARLRTGDSVAVDIFEGVTKVDVIGATKGKGFQGVMRRHGFGGGRATHGSMRGMQMRSSVVPCGRRERPR